MELPAKKSSSAVEKKDVSKTKKQLSHRESEQERRNRLNNAISSLESLLPKDLKDSVAIPSKAGTVELAVKYIKQLHERLGI